jgi:hypothetical protein
MVKLQNIDQAKARKQQRKNHFCNGIARSKRKNQVTINNDGVLGVKLAGLSLLPWKNWLLQSKPTRIWFLRIYSSRDYKGKNQVVGYGKTKMIFSPYRGLQTSGFF